MGMILAVEYKPCLNGEMAKPLLLEFIESLQLTKSEPNSDAGFDEESSSIQADDENDASGDYEAGISFQVKDLPTILGEEKDFRYKVQHTILQYIEVLSKIRNTASL